MNEACAGMGDVLVVVREDSDVEVTIDGALIIMSAQTASDLASLIEIALRLAGVDVEDE